MSEAPSVLANIALCLAHQGLRERWRWAGTPLLAAAVLFNGWSLLPPAGPAGGGVIKTAFLLFWLVVLFARLEGGKGRDMPTEPLVCLPIISLLDHDYLYVSTLVLVLLFTLIKLWDQERISRYAHVLVAMAAAVQFLLLDVGETDLGGIFDDLVHGGSLRPANLHMISAIVGFFIFIMMTRKDNNIEIRRFMKLAFVVSIIRISQLVGFDALSPHVSYSVVFLAVVVILPFSNFDMTVYLLSVSLAFPMSRDAAGILPVYYVASVALGETINLLSKRGGTPVKVAACALLLPYVNPFVTDVFSSLGTIPLSLAVVFSLCYARMLASLFEGRA